MNLPVDLFQNFSGRAPLVPLRDTVLFPQMLLPLQISEPHPRRMVGDAREGEQLVATALLKPGWEPRNEPLPAVYPVVCLCRIAAMERLPSGRCHLLLEGLQRARIVEEERSELPYRVARLELQQDIVPVSSGAHRSVLRSRLLAGFYHLFPHVMGSGDLHRLFDADLPLGRLCDLIADTLRLEPEPAQAVLEELDVEQRCQRVMDGIHRRSAQQGPGLGACNFPPRFSSN